MLPEDHGFFGQRKVVRYAIAVLATAAAIGVRALLDPWVGNHIPFALNFLAIIVIGWTCGMGPGVAAMLLGFITANYLFVQPRHTFAIVTAGDLADTITYFIISLGSLWILHIQRTTHQRAVEGEQLARNRLLELEAIYLQAPIGLFFLDRNYRYVRINESLAATTGHTPEQRIGRTVWEMVPELESVLRPVLERVLSTGEPIDKIEIRARLKGNPQERCWLGSYHPVRDRDGRILGLNGTVQDITDRKLAEERIRQLNLELEQRVRARTADLESFTNSVSHDLRAPVRTICSLTELAIMDSGPQLSPENRELLQSVIDAAKRMDRLILDLLTLSRLSRQELQQKIVNLSDIAESIASDLCKAHPRRATRTRFDIAPGLTVCGDEHFLRIALENLLDNAWKFTSIHPLGHIEFGMEHEDGEAVYYVRDDGIGFDMAHAGRLFGIFERLHNIEEFPGTAAGTGMGLALVQRIITRHDGRIWATSIPGKGATFYFTLSRSQTQCQSPPPAAQPVHNALQMVEG